MGGTYSKELELAKSLQSLCDDAGKEINPIKSSEILYQFGLVYKSKSPDKISLIQSAVFFNAAIVRQPKNRDFHEALEDLCNHILLKSSNRRKPQTNLINIANIAALKVKEMRIYTKTVLSKLKKIPFVLTKQQKQIMEKERVEVVRKLQSVISNKYTRIMNFVSEKSEEAMGKPPCEYAVTGMGSLARKEITPYSDFEHVIVLEEGVQHREDYEDNILEYFRWFTVVFNIIIINLQESIIRSVAVPLLNDDSIPGGDWFFDAHTTCGIKFDGMQLPACKFPLGRTRETDNKPFTIELIKPVSEMVNFLETDEDIKNGYHLADILTKTCFVSGSHQIHVCFANAVKKFFAGKANFRISQYMCQVLEHASEFDAFKSVNSLSSSTKCNIKRIVYRTVTLFLSALGCVLFIDKYSCFDIVDIMLEKNVITSETAHKLMYAISVACEVRLKVYMDKKGQDDFLGGRDYEVYDYKALHELAQYIGEQSLVDYFETCTSLQLAMKNGNSSGLNNLECLPVIRFRILLALGQRSLLLSEWKKYTKRGKNDPTDDDLWIRLTVATIYVRMNDAKSALNILEEIDDQATADAFISSSIMLQKLFCLSMLKNYVKALGYVKVVKAKLNCLKLEQDQHNIFLFFCLRTEADCQQEMKQYKEAILLYKEATSYIDTSISKQQDEDLAGCYHMMGRCYSHIGQSKESIASHTQALTLYNQSKAIFSLICSCYKSLGHEYSDLFMFDEALKCFHTELMIRLENVSVTLHGVNEDIVSCQQSIQKVTVAKKLGLGNSFCKTH